MSDNENGFSLENFLYKSEVVSRVELLSMKANLESLISVVLEADQLQEQQKRHNNILRGYLSDYAESLPQEMAEVVLQLVHDQNSDEGSLGSDNS